MEHASLPCAVIVFNHMCSGTDFIRYQSTAGSGMIKRQ